MWTGSLAFGLVNVPVKMYTATEDHAVRFHQVHLKDGGRIRMKRVCSVCGEEVAFKDIGKGWEDASGQRIVLDAEDLEELPVGPKKEIDVLEFVPADQVDPILFDNTYYLEPDGRALKPYVLLRQALESTERMAIVKVAIRQRTQLAALRVREDVLVLQTMLWPDEVREADFDFLGEKVEVRPQELTMAKSLIENLSGDFEPAQYTDEYREAILKLIDAKLSGGEGITVEGEEEAADAGAVVDLMAALQASVARTKKAEPEPEAAKPVRKRAPAKKTAAKRTAKSA
jgi:DNA end-binding protein Ku